MLTNIVKSIPDAALAGLSDIAGDDFAIGQSEPNQPHSPESVLNFSIGISSGFQGSEQPSFIAVNGYRLTSAAGGQDDRAGGNGPRQGDEYCNLKQFVQSGDLLINVPRYNPSNDDNFLFAGRLVSGGAVVGEGALLAPNSSNVQKGNGATAAGSS